MQLIRISIALLAAAMLASCATQPPQQSGRHMVLRDISGRLVMQFDYPTDDLCAKTSAAMRGTIYKAACAPTSAAEQLQGHAMLRYTPPGAPVQAHYTDLAACSALTAQLSAGVELIQACSAK